MKKMIFGLMIISFIFLNAKEVQALILPQMTMEEMVLGADVIVTGKSEHFHIHPGHEGEVLYAFVTFKVDEYLKNNLGEDEIIVMHIAQERDLDGKLVAGSFALRMDEEVILFLTEEDNQGFRHVFGLSQGKYSVIQDWRGGKRLLQDMKSVRLYNKETGRISKAKNIRIEFAYEEFKTLVRQIVSRIEAKKEMFVSVRPNSSF